MYIAMAGNIQHSLYFIVLMGVNIHVKASIILIYIKFPQIWHYLFILMLGGVFETTNSFHPSMHRIILLLFGKGRMHSPSTCSAMFY